MLCTKMPGRGGTGTKSDAKNSKGARSKSELDILHQAMMRAEVRAVLELTEALRKLYAPAWGVKLLVICSILKLLWGAVGRRCAWPCPGSTLHGTTFRASSTLLCIWLQNKVGGGEGLVGIYGSMTQQGTCNIMQAMAEHTGLGKDSVFVDIGSGLCRWVQHAWIAPPTNMKHDAWACMRPCSGTCQVLLSA